MQCILSCQVQVNACNVDRMLDDLLVQNGDYDTPPPPALPWWFNADCETKLMAASEPVQSLNVVTPAPTQSQTPPVVSPPVPQDSEQLKQQLKAQLEYYFSRYEIYSFPY